MKTENEKLIEDINKFQNIGIVHPLTCGKNSLHENLVPFIDTDNVVKLKCPDCDYVQNINEDMKNYIRRSIICFSKFSLNNV